MSLDVYLMAETPKKKHCFSCGSEYDDYECFFEANITHNLGTMAEKAGIYQHLWRPEELGITKAGELIEPIRMGLLDMKARPEYYRQFDSPNGWGRYDHFVPWIEEYLRACINYPDAVIRISR